MAKKLSKIKVGMSVKQLTDLFGQPNFILNQSAMMEMFGSVAGNTPANLVARENRVFKTQYGEFHTII